MELELRLEYLVETMTQNIQQIKYQFSITLLPGKRTGLFVCLVSLALSSFGQNELRLMAETGVEKSIYSMSSNIDNLNSPKEYFAPLGLGLAYKFSGFLMTAKYENRNFRMAGPSYRDDLGGFNRFGLRGPNRIHSSNLLIGYDILKYSEKIECIPELGFGFGYMRGYEIFDREPTFQDSANRSSFTIINVEDSNIVQSGSIHHLYSSNVMSWGRIGVRFSYQLKTNFLLHVKMSYTYGFIPFYKSIFRIEDEGLNSPIIGNTSNSATSFGVRFGISYRIPLRKHQSQTELTD